MSSDACEPHTVLVSFRLRANVELKLSDGEKVSFMLESQAATLERTGTWYRVRIENCIDAIAADMLCQRLIVGLKLAAVRKQLSLEVFETRASIVHGFGDGKLPAVFPSAQKPAFWFVPESTAHSSVAPTWLLEALHLPTAGPGDRQLDVAIDFYFSSFVLATREAKLIALVMSLEALRRKEPNHVAVTALVDRWIAESRSAAARASNDDPSSKVPLQELSQNMSYLKEMSLTKQLKAIVRDAFASDGPQAADQAAGVIGHCYSVRSRLAHGTRVSDGDLLAALSDLQGLLPRVLLFRAGSVSASSPAHP